MPFLNTTPLKVSTSDGRNVTLLEPLIYVTKAGITHTVPAGAKSDGFSTPREIWFYFPPFGIGWYASILHDHLYRDVAGPKDYANDIFLEAMESLGVNAVDRRIIYNGVKYGGGAAFEADRKELEDKLK